MIASRERCATRAYRAGTEASRNEHTVMTAKLCVMSGEAFFCHEPLGPGGEPTRLCVGFEAARVAQAAQPEWRASTADTMLHLLEMAEDDASQFDTDEKYIAAIRRLILGEELPS